MYLSRVSTLLVCLFAAVPLHAARIRSINPSRIQAGQTSRVIVSGDGLSKVKGCLIEPAAAAAAVPASTAPLCTVQRVNQQLLLTIQKEAIPAAGNYFVLLTAKPAPAPTDTLTAAGRIFVFAKDAAASPDDTTNSAGTAPGTVSPYTDCLSQTNAPDHLSNIKVTTTGVNCGSSVLGDGETSDNFGGHVSARYSAIQVRVSNRNPQYDFLLRDVVLTLPDGRVVSGRIRRFAQGVAVKGKTLDRRALVFNSLTAAGGVYGALTVFASAGFKTAGNVFQGAFLGGFSTILPDSTAENINRFNTAVFDDQNPTIVPKDSIGQPPLYVIALVPKEKGIGDAFEYAKSIGVAVEGTYIKQVTLVTLSPATLAFDPEFIAPPDFRQSKSPSFDFSGLMSLKEDTRTLVVENPNPTTLNARGFHILPGNAAQAAGAPDFVIDAAGTTCGIGGSSGKPSSGTDPFTIPANSSCLISIRSTPTHLGATSATFVLDGDNLDGAKSVPLTGSGVGLVLAAQSANARPFACSYINRATCQYDLGSLDPSTTTINVLAYYSSGDPADNLTAGAKSCPGSAVFPSVNSGCLVTVAINSTGSTDVSFSDPKLLKDTPLKVTFTYATITTTINIATTITTTAQGPAATASVTAVSGSSKPTGRLTYAIDGDSQSPRSVTLSDGNANLDFSGLQPGTYRITRLDYVGGGSFKSSSFQSLPIALTIKPPLPAITIGPAPGNATLSSPISIPITVKAGTTPCAGTLTPTIVSGTNPVPSAPVNILAGAGQLNFTLGSAQATYSITANFQPNTTACDAASVTAATTLTLP